MLFRVVGRMRRPDGCENDTFLSLALGGLSGRWSSPPRVAGLSADVVNVPQPRSVVTVVVSSAF